MACMYALVLRCGSERVSSVSQSSKFSAKTAGMPAGAQTASAYIILHLETVRRVSDGSLSRAIELPVDRKKRVKVEKDTKAPRAKKYSLTSRFFSLCFCFFFFFDVRDVRHNILNSTYSLRWP